MTMTSELLEEIETNNNRASPRYGMWATEVVAALVTEVKRQRNHINWYEYHHKAKTARIEQLYKELIALRDTFK